MSKGAKKSGNSSNLVVAPPPPPQIGDERKAGKHGGKKPLDAREYPLARDARGTASRGEIRRETRRVAAPRQSNRPAERHNQSRSHISKKPAGK